MAKRDDEEEIYTTVTRQITTGKYKGTNTRPDMHQVTRSPEYRPEDGTMEAKRIAPNAFRLTLLLEEA